MEPNYTILVVDDNEIERRRLAAMITSIGHRAVLAEHGLDALRLVREAAPHCVLLDVVMPDIDGFKVAAAIKAQPRFLPVILLTQLDDLETRRRGQAAGADDFLIKPVQQADLQIRIAAMTRIRTAMESLETANHKLGELATTDPLTGLLNRRRFDELLSIEYKRAARHGRPLAVVTVDIDHFKKFNDRHGHAVGDEVLRAVASAIAQSLRVTDHIGRTGGEEFVIVAPDTSNAGALALGERLRRCVELLRIESPSGPLRVTVSIGAAGWDGRGKPGIPALLRESDGALYTAKNKGRNRVAFATVRPIGGA